MLAISITSCLFFLSGDSKIVTSILEGPRFPVVLFFCTFGYFLVGLTVTGVVMAVVATVVSSDTVLDRLSVVVLEIMGVVLSDSVDSGKPEVCDSVDAVRVSVPIVVSLVKPLVVPVLLDDSL